MNRRERRRRWQHARSVHAFAAGEKCIDDGHGRCRGCRVRLVRCELCKGVGFHVPTCDRAFAGNGNQVATSEVRQSVGVLLLGIALALIAIVAVMFGAP